MNHGSSYDDIGAMLQFVIENVYKPPLSYHAERYLLSEKITEASLPSKRQKTFYSN